MKYFISLILILTLLAACQNTTEDIIPTLAEPNALATSIVLTRFAPPAGFGTLSLPKIDANLEALSGWRYDMTFAFDGVFSRTTRAAHTATTASVSYNQLASSRHVAVEVDNDLENPTDPTHLEGVRLGPDTFLVRDGVCLQNAGEDADLLADLGAGDLLGGVREATAAAQIATINSQEVWRYAFLPEDLILPSITLTPESKILELRSDLWFSPRHNAVVRFYLTAEVENILLSQASLPVSGTLILRYDVYDLGIVPNINVPFGC